MKRKTDNLLSLSSSRAFAVVASALGIPSLLPFLKAVCKSKKSWQARHTGIKIVQQIAILMGCAILPHLKNLVEIIEHGRASCIYTLALYTWSILHTLLSKISLLLAFLKNLSLNLQNCTIFLIQTISE